ncbi:DUF1604-domain-containing protein [Pseudovirgaria hyperparasitica]|uniref:DUF1604-domain-containing protein n=1 Tax=Pseudovirgaria hyperparasitica TaxID=470096 RepID=A0A6A6WI19_9PEZI|nr:DUF1604-domain-containing protein [Pseudovirgaria hyperparasitica]KAF2761724.1 DUF1604-domain-containing protein [Pseudovirgaria hyperparasitica]
MPSKRTRAAFEEDLQAQQSPYVFFGTALPPIDPSVRDDGSYVPIWKQTATDDQGRRRLHGAFTGGFSAGYFNTVGSKEGWTPSNFVSSRQKRHLDAATPTVQRPEDFMDEEDLADAADSERIHTSKSFASIGATPAEQAKLNLARGSEDTIGARLLQKMGWRKGQGIGPKVRRKADLGPEIEGVDTDDLTSSSHFFAPPNSPLVLIIRKEDHKGLGFGTVQDKALSRAGDLPDNEWHGLRDPVDPGLKKKQKQSQSKKSGFGLGVLNDTGSDDEDPYSMGPRISFTSVSNRDIKSKKAGSKKSPAINVPRAATQPLLSSKNRIERQKAVTCQKCHDGKLPLQGFHLSKHSLRLSGPSFPLPRIPQGWSSKIELQTGVNGPGVVKETEKATLDPVSRARILGETPLPGKSVFDFMSADARNRIASASGRTNLPPGRGENISGGLNKTVEMLSDLIRPPPAEAAEAALRRLVGGWNPYGTDQDKALRYQTFLEICTSPKLGLPDQPKGMSKKDWIGELEEFAHAAQVFKPVTGMMASRFTAASSHSTANAPEQVSQVSGTLTKSNGAQEAARAGMFGPLTRSIHQFYPTRLLCKRFGVPPPNLASGDKPSEPVNNPISTSGMGVQDFPSQSRDSTLIVKTSDAYTANPVSLASTQPAVPPVVDAESNTALEESRAAQEIFDAIFNSG